MPEKTWEPEPLREAVWKDMPGAGAEQPGGAELQRVLERAEDLGGEMNGVAYTTSGAYSVRRAGASGLTTLIEKNGQTGSREQEIDLDTVFELRLWRVMGKKTAATSPAGTASWPTSCGGLTAVGPQRSWSARPARVSRAAATAGFGTTATSSTERKATSWTASRSSPWRRRTETPYSPTSS